MTLNEKFKALEAENAPGQELRQELGDINTIMHGEKLEGSFVDFSHGDVNAFTPTPGASKTWMKGFDLGGEQAYTEYRGATKIREGLASRLAIFTGSSILAHDELIITPGTQGALFLALGSVVEAGEKVAVIEPDYFANRKLVKYFGGLVIPIPLSYQDSLSKSGPDLKILEEAFKQGTKTLVFSTPNNPTGVVYSKDTINAISELAVQYNITVIVDQLYSRLLYSDETYTHLRACKKVPKNIITIMGPSKTESLSGFRLGVAFGTASIIDRMERLQAIVSLRAAGYNQAVLNGWFKEPSGWMDERISLHEAIRDDLLDVFNQAGLLTATPQAGSYLFPSIPSLDINLKSFIQLLRYQASVIVTPGSEFGPTTVNSIRLNFSQDHIKAVAAAKRIVEMFKRYKK